MGYRIRLGRVSKSEKEKYAGKSCEEVMKDLGDDLSPYRPPFHEQLYEIGKYVDYPECRSPFYDFDVYEECEGEFDILSKEGLLKIIDAHHTDVFEYYQKLFESAAGIFIEKNGTEEDREELEAEVVSSFRRMMNEWDRKYRLKPYRLEDREDGESWDGDISGSWLKEYVIFNLAHIYRNFDWENDYLIYSGW